MWFTGEQKTREQSNWSASARKPSGDEQASQQPGELLEHGVKLR
jgi:hypothetical protein